MTFPHRHHGVPTPDDLPVRVAGAAHGQTPQAPSLSLDFLLLHLQDARASGVLRDVLPEVKMVERAVRQAMGRDHT